MRGDTGLFGLFGLRRLRRDLCGDLEPLLDAGAEIRRVLTDPVPVNIPDFRGLADAKGFAPRLQPRGADADRTRGAKAGLQLRKTGGQRVDRLGAGAGPDIDR